MSNRGCRENLTNAGKGRPKGVPNKLNASVKEAIVEAFNRAGGVDYLVQVAKDDPKTFCALVGKVIPLEVSGVNGNPIEIKTIEVTFVRPEDKR